MKYLLILFTALGLQATDTINFIDLTAQSRDGKLVITTQPRSLLDYDIFKTEDYSIQKLDVDQILDAPMRLTAFMLRTLDRNRGTLVAGSSPLPILRFEFELALRQPTGEVISSMKYRVLVGLDGEAGMGLITVEGSSANYRFSLAELTNKEAFTRFINHLSFPYGESSFPEPRQNECLLDLYYTWPTLVQDEKKVNVFDLFPAWLTYSEKGRLRKLGVHMGSTFLKRVNGQWEQSFSSSLYCLRDAIELYGRVLEVAKKGNARTTIPLLEEYVGRVPGDKKALKLLMDTYLEDERNDQAYDLISRFRPLFATIRGGLPNQKALAEKADQHRNWLLGRRASFKRDEQAQLKILSPVADDLVTGRTELKFSLSGHTGKVVAIDCFLGDQLITQLTEPPYETPFTVDGTRGKADLRVVAYFDNETYQEGRVSFRTITVDSQEAVQLVTVRSTVLQSAAEKVLSADDFRIEENDLPQTLNSFRKDTAPLRVAILMDTSISMVGDKLYRAQYAVKTFLSKLSPEDRASLYSFDQQVLRLSDFTNDHNELAKNVMTLSLQWGTSLYDAILIAHDGLMGQNGTKIMIVVSDGDDSSSSTTDLHVAGVLRDSPVMVYSIILSGGPMSSGNTGSELLKSLAEMTGSISLKVRSLDKLDATFDRVYEDFKSLYYMDYYSSLALAEQRKLTVKVKGAKVRARALN